jgi:hypothetical protein
VGEAVVVNERDGVRGDSDLSRARLVSRVELLVEGNQARKYGAGVKGDYFGPAIGESETRE